MTMAHRHLVEMLNVSSTTEPIQRHIGSVVELTFNKSVVPRVRMVGPESSACVNKLYLFPTQHSLPSAFQRCSLFYVALESITSYCFSEDSNLGQDLYPVPFVC
jgi:hypothetical protein